MTAPFSAKGLFPAPVSHGLALRTHNRRKKADKARAEREKLDAFADLLADGYEPEAAAVMLGRVLEHGQTMLNALCRKLGGQAR